MPCLLQAHRGSTLGLSPGLGKSPPNAEQEQNKPHVIRASQEIRNRPGPRAQPRTSCSPSSRTSKQRRSPKTSWMKHRCPGKPEGSGDSSEVQGQWLPACVSSMAGRGALPSVSEGRRMLPIEQGQPFSHTHQLCHRPFSHQWASLWPSGGLQEVNVAAKEVLSGDRPQSLPASESFPMSQLFA